jgi:hypothetical protein
MNKNYKVACLILLGFIIILSGCGGLEGAPGSDSGDTGILIQSVSIIGDEPAGGDNEIDVAIHFCPPDFTELEPGLFIANANLTIQAAPVAFDPFPASVEECTVTYLKGNENPDAPIIENMTIYPNCTILNGTNDCNFVMMDIDRKVKFWDDLLLSPSMIRPVHYVARFQCGFVNVYSESGS